MASTSQIIPSAPPPSVPGWRALVSLRPDGTPNLDGKVGETVLVSERVLLVHVKNRPLKAILPDIDKVTLFILPMGDAASWTFDRKMEYLMEQLENSTIKADDFRHFWKTQYFGKVSKKGGYFTRGDTIKLIANRLVTQHGSFGQERVRDR
eukprot:1012425-Karenia_brevis.AAC.1